MKDVSSRIENNVNILTYYPDPASDEVEDLVCSTVWDEVDARVLFGVGVRIAESIIAE